MTSTPLSEPERRLLQVLYDAKKGAGGHSGDIYLTAAASAISKPRNDTISIINQLRGSGLIETDSLDTVRISPLGVQAIEDEKAENAAQTRWINRHPALGYRLADPPPSSVDEIRQALAHATQIMTSTQGSGAPVYEQARAISELLKQDLQIALAREGTTRPTAGSSSFWSRAIGSALAHVWSIVVTIIAALILFYVFGIG